MIEWLKKTWRRLTCPHPWWHVTGARVGLHPLARLQEQHVCVECGKVKWFYGDRMGPVNDRRYPHNPTRKLFQLDPAERWRDAARKLS